MNKSVVRILKLEIENFKNVEHGTISFMNDASLRRRLEFEKGDIVGLYGPNGSGKSAAVEAFDILKNILRGEEISFEQYNELIDNQKRTRICVSFFVQVSENNCMLASYDVSLIVNREQNIIELRSEKISFNKYTGKGWTRDKFLEIRNPYAESNFLLSDDKTELVSNPATLSKNDIFSNIDRIALVCAQHGVSVCFYDVVLRKIKEVYKTNENKDLKSLGELIFALNFFARMKFQVVKVDQLGVINVSTFIPLLLHQENTESMQSGVLPLKTDEDSVILKQHMPLLKNSLEAINVAMKGIVPDLSLVVETKDEITKDDKEYIKVAIFAVRSGKKFSIKHESEGIKRIISLMAFLTTLYSDRSVCLVVDELDDGIFEFLLGEMLGTLGEEANGQLIFTSHNLRAFEKLSVKNIVCTTTNASNRYIRLKGIAGNNNKRDFYIRALRIGGQEEELYNMNDLDNIGYALMSASKIINKNERNDDSVKFIKNLEEKNK